VEVFPNQQFNSSTNQHFFTIHDSLLTIHGTYRIDPHAAWQHHLNMKIISPTLEKGGQGGFESDGQPIESHSISLYPKGEVWGRIL
jgi:hypothetical protein